MNGYFAFALIAVVLVGLYIGLSRGTKRKPAPPKSDPLPPLPEEDDHNGNKGNSK